MKWRSLAEYTIHLARIGNDRLCRLQELNLAAWAINPMSTPTALSLHDGRFFTVAAQPRKSVIVFAGFTPHTCGPVFPHEVSYFPDI